MRTQHLILVSGLLAACGTSTSQPVAPEGAAGEVTLLHSARLEGEIEPCG